MSAIIKRLEELSFQTLPALDQERYDGWVLRWSGGGARRANSANPMGASTLPFEEKIRYCEQWFGDRQAPPVFRLTPLAEDRLDEALDEAGYDRASPTAVMTAAMGAYESHRDVVVLDSPTDAWLRAIPGHTDDDSAGLARLRHQLTSSGGQNRFASIEVAGAIVAIGMSLDLDGTTTVYNMNTSEPARRRGHARRILDSLLAHGAAAGSTRAVLQVTWENEPALSLYETAGFSATYTYHYRERLRR